MLLETTGRNGSGSDEMKPRAEVPACEHAYAFHCTHELDRRKEKASNAEKLVSWRIKMSKELPRFSNRTIHQLHICQTS